MLKEVDILGVYVSPFSVYCVIAVLLFLPLRVLFDRLEVQRWFWHRALFDTAVFVIILSLVGLIF